MRALLLMLAACAVDAPAEAPYAWDVPASFPVPRVPEDNPMSAAKVELGRRLFYDARLSANGTQSCASCHQQARAFTDGGATSPGSTGAHGRHGAMSLANVGYASSLTWAQNIASLEEQALVPMYGTAPVELGLDHARDAELLDRLRDDYGDLALPDIARALAAFERTIISSDTRFDRFLAGTAELTPTELAGKALFESARLGCATCHGTFAFTSSIDDNNAFFNTGLYDVDGRGSYPAADRGLVELTGNPEHEGRFRPPTLRNIALTAPYLHDGSAATLDDVLDIYAAGGRGAGRTSPRKTSLVRGFALSADERTAVLAFLSALTDDTLLTTPSLSNPW